MDTRGHAADLPRGATANLVLTFSDTAAIVDVVGVTSTVEVAVADGAKSFPLVVTSAPAAYMVGLEQAASDPGAPIDTTIRVSNVGRTTGQDVRVSLELPDGMNWQGSGWAACPADVTGDLCQTVSTVAPSTRANLPLRLIAPPGHVPSGNHPLVITATDAVGGTDSQTVQVQVHQAPASFSAEIQAPAVLTGAETGPVVVEVANSGGTAGSARVALTLPDGLQPVSLGLGSWTERSGAPGVYEQAVTVALENSVSLTLDVTRTPAVDQDVMQTISVDLNAAGAPVTRPIRLVSAPAAISFGDTPLFVDPSTYEGVEPGVVTVDVSNTGGTTATGVTVSVTLPAGLAVQDGSGWTQRDTTVYDRTITLGPGGTATVTLPVTSTVVAAEVSGDVGVDVTYGGAAPITVQHTVTVIPAPATSSLTITGSVHTPFVAGHDGEVWFTITNTGNTTLRNLQAQVLKKRPMTWVDEDRTDGWLCSSYGAPSDVDAVCTPINGDLGPGDATVLELVMNSPTHTENGHVLPVRISVSADGVAAVDGTINVPVAEHH